MSQAKATHVNEMKAKNEELERAKHNAKAVTAAVAEERAKNSESLEQARKDVAEQRKIAAELRKGQALEKASHVNEMKDKDEELKKMQKQCEKFEKDIENAKNAEEAARQELLQARQTFENEVKELRESKVMLFFPFSANTV